MLAIRAARSGEIGFLHDLDPLATPGSERHQQIGMWVAGGDCHVALLDGVVAGYVVSSYGFFHQRFIELVMVASAYRRQGVGRALIQHILELAPNEKLWTSTNESNAPMRELLAHAGFIPSGRVDNLDPGDPELIFVHLPKVTPVEAAAR